MNKKYTKKRKRFSKRRRKKYYLSIISAALVIISVVVISYQTISDIIAKNWIGGENYQRQPVDAALQSIVLVVVLVVAGVSIWEFIIKKKKQKR